MGTPLVSVILPTMARPHVLPRAVNSALEGMGDAVEVIVVPNGSDRSWEQSLQPFANDKRVIVSPIEIANANAARNHGLGLSRGEFVRFLDDDDYLYPEPSAVQYDAMDRDKVDVISGGLEIVDDASGKTIRSLQMPETSDFCAAVLGPTRKCLLHMHVYRRHLIRDVRWRLDAKVRQDVEWQFQLCALREWRWSKSDTPVGAWCQHWGARVSRATSYNEIRASTVEMIVALHNCLESDGRSTTERRLAASSGLWELVHSCFHLSPGYWSNVARIADHISPGSKPKAPIFHWPGARHLSPVFLEWALLPKRWASHQIVMAGRRLKVRHAW